MKSIPWSCLAAILPLLAAAAEDGLAVLRGEAQAIGAVRDALVGRLGDRITADEAIEPASLFTLVFPDALAPAGSDKPDRRALSVTLPCCGGRFYAGSGTSPKYNKASHVVDGAALTLSRGILSGELRVTVKSDTWVPPDGRKRALLLRFEVPVRDGLVQAGTAQISGDYGTYSGGVSGSLQPLTRSPAAPSLTPATQAGAQAEAWAAFASAAYQELRAAVLCLRYYPLAFDQALASTRLPIPAWPAQGEAERLAHVRAVRALAAGAEAAIDAKPDWVDGSLPCDDPCFGTHFGEDPLPVEDGVVRLPGDAGSDGGQRWQFVPRWHLLAAFPPDPQRTLVTPGLPELLFTPGASYPIDKERMEPAYKPPLGDRCAWVQAISSIRQIPPPGQEFFPDMSAGHHGVRKGIYGVHGATRARWYAATVIRAERACDMYAALLADDHGKLYVNGRLAWVSDPALKAERCNPRCLARIHFEAGDNQVLMVCENDNKDSLIAVLLCTRGRPLAPQARVEALRRCAEASAALPPLAIRGRNGDYTSRYPEADPPLAWDLKAGTNIRWHTVLPDFSCASPVVVGKRCFVNCEPHTLYCLDADSGDIVWKRDAHVFMFVPEAERAAALRSWDDARAVEESEEVRAFDGDIARIELKLNDDTEAREARDASRQLEAEERGQYAKQLSDLKKQRDTFVASRTEAYRKWSGLLGIRFDGWGVDYGQTFGAPVSDGKQVWVKFGTGVAACYDLDGHERWLVHTRLSGGTGNIASPVLVQGVFVIQGQGPITKEARGDAPPFMEHTLLGLDAATGKELWRRPIKNTGGYGGASGLVPLRVSNGTITREFVINGDAVIVDPLTGRLESNCLGAGGYVWAGDPLVLGNRAYYKPWVIEFWLEDDGRLGSKAVMQCAAPGMPGRVLHAGRIWGPARGTAASTCKWMGFSYASLDGGPDATVFPVLREAGKEYLPPAAAGDYVVIGGNGTLPHAWNVNPKESAELGFVHAASPEPWLVSYAKTEDEAMTAAPVFVGKRMYLRTYRAAICVEVRDKDGAIYVLRARDRSLLETLGPKPEAGKVRALPCARSWQPAPGVPVETMVILPLPADAKGYVAPGPQGAAAPQAWLSVGPFPLQADVDPLAAFGGPAKVLADPAQAFRFQDQECRFAPVDPRFVSASKGWSYYKPGNYNTYGAGSSIEVFDSIGRKAETVTYYFAALSNDQARTVRVNLKGGKTVRAWLAGQEVAMDDQVRLEPGLYPILLRAEIGRVASFVKQIGVGFSLRYIKDPEADLRDWYERAEKIRERLHAVQEMLPPCDERLRASMVLTTLANHHP